MANQENEANQVINFGEYSHAVPTVNGATVLMSDEQHFGTLIVLIKEGITDVFPEYFFSNVECGTVDSSPRCALIGLSKGWKKKRKSADIHGHGFGLDLDSMVGLFGCDPDDDVSGIGDVLWDSSTPGAVDDVSGIGDVLWDLSTPDAVDA